jgi:hypothetical protein
MLEGMRVNYARTLAIVTILLAFCTLAIAMLLGGDIPIIVLGLVLAAASMELFQHANPEREDE